MAFGVRSCSDVRRLKSKHPHSPGRSNVNITNDQKQLLKIVICSSLEFLLSLSNIFVDMHSEMWRHEIHNSISKISSSSSCLDNAVVSDAILRVMSSSQGASRLCPIAHSSSTSSFLWVPLARVCMM